MAWLGERTWPELEALDPRPILAVPLGATEQHGPHLPLCTDTEIARALAARLAASEPGILVAPPLAYGSSGEHADFPGTLSIGAAATELVLVELCRSASSSFDRVLLISAHGGNAEPLAAASAVLREEGRDVRAVSPSWGGDAHAGRTETSLMLAIAPILVDLDRAEPGNAAPVSSLLPSLRREGVRACLPTAFLATRRVPRRRRGSDCWPQP